MCQYYHTWRGRKSTVYSSQSTVESLRLRRGERFVALATASRRRGRQAPNNWLAHPPHIN
jgi:hypothetical protein